MSLLLALVPFLLRLFDPEIRIPLAIRKGPSRMPREFSLSPPFFLGEERVERALGIIEEMKDTGRIS